eukprot:CAMPEP_0174383924 /NCGR_PEP_ID=MMETSP0811_2-20130205/125577_1 /TAXON_ID=73025 ORGANISM="Eutreptiella gymnastica-like, Strain CCMP1594" /NCGR_SAMPLE_ID=MMETSP0811_2 /ASSEMBLY_ACC=CAM_ASM_000667 /LENGTH=87 /DNA_ID=CAMNT_0015537707 /DNA_START=581 /DNA_END=844 /DNA_ORIENTATION=-
MHPWDADPGLAGEKETVVHEPLQCRRLDRTGCTNSTKLWYMIHEQRSVLRNVQEQPHLVRVGDMVQRWVQTDWWVEGQGSSLCSRPA